MPYFISDQADGCAGWATVKEDGEVIGCHTTKADAIAQMVAVSIAEGMEPGGERADAPAPPSDQVTGSEDNPEGSAGGKSGGIVLSDATVTALENKAKDHNDAMAERDRPSWTRVTLGALKAVYRRGSGAYSTSHRPGIGRAQWSMARVNAFLYLARSGAPENSNYVGDNDLLNKEHPKYSEAKSLRALPENYRPALAADVPEGRACGNCYFYDESNVKGDKAWCERWDDYVSGAYYCNAWQPDESHIEDDSPDEARAVSAPEWLRDNARRGLEWLREGYAGDGLTEKTKAEARAMAAGTVSDDKVIRMGAWFARHMADLEGTDRNTDPPTAGMVAHALWGGWPIDESRRAMRWAEDNSASRQVPRMTGARMATKVETRQIVVDQLEVRETGNGMSFSGYAAVFNSPSEPLPFTEIIREGAFSKSLRAKNNVMMLFSHDTSQPLASTRSKTMTLMEDSRGLLVDAALPQTSLGRDVAELLRSKVVDSMSFGFSVPARGDIWSADGQTRELTEIRLHEVSVVSFPAYTKTSASVRSIDILADKTGADAETLSAALDALESGNALTRDQATMLTTVVEKLAPESETVPELIEDNSVSVTLARLRDELDLNFKTL